MNDLFILSEKNTQQAFKYAEALLGSHKQNSDGFYEGIWNGRTVVIGYLGGHVYEQYAPEDYTEAWNGLTANPYDLIKEQPLIPSEWKIKPKNSKIGKFTAKQLIKKVEKYGKDSYEIYLATDPDREGTVLGQEIFRELNLFDKVTKRVYANDMASSQIKKAFLNAVPIKQDELLYLAGLERQRVDWLGGTAAFSLMKTENALRGDIGKGTGSIGRVKNGVANFINHINEILDNWDEDAPENNSYGIVMITADGLRLKSSRQAKRQGQADYWVAQHQHINTANVETSDILQKVNAPKFFNLVTLQTWAKKNKIKDEILPYLNTIALKGYITYPRAAVDVISSSFRDENLLPQVEDVKSLLEVKLELPNKETFDSPWINNKKVKNAGHTAIVYGGNVPSPEELKALGENEQKLYKIIGLRTLGPMLPEGIDRVRTYSTQIDDMEFQSRTSCIDKKGWREITELNNTNVDNSVNVEFIDGGMKNIRFESERIKRRPPVRIRPDNIIRLMEKYGLGTMATQEKIVKEMIEYEQIKYNGKYYELTERGQSLVDNQPLYTFNSTKELGVMLSDIQGLGDSGTIIPPGEAIKEISNRINEWKLTLLLKIRPDFRYFEQRPENENKISIMNSKGQTLKFNRLAFGHVFTDEECTKLANGEEIIIINEKGEEVTGSLKEDKYKGRNYIRFMPTWDKKYSKAKGV